MAPFLFQRLQSLIPREFFFTEYRKIQISEFHILFRKQTAACEQQCPQYCGHYDFPLSPFDFHPSSTVKTSLLHIYVKKAEIYSCSVPISLIFILFSFEDVRYNR